MVQHGGQLVLVNRTRYDTRDLRRLTILCLKERGAYAGRRYRVTWVPARGAWPHGLAWIGRPFVRMMLPAARVEAVGDGGRRAVGLAALDRRTIERLAQVLLHEIDHTLGLNHREMLNCYSLPVWFLPADIRVRPKGSRNAGTD
jgi:hypothetical protein